MKKGWVVTIGREFCSGGAEVAEKLAQRLSIPYYNRDLISEAVERTNLSREKVVELDEAYRRGDLYGKGYRYRDDPSLILPEHLRVYEAQCDAIRHMAGDGPCIFVGRCADYVLGECANVLNVISVFIRADLEKRVARGVRMYPIPEEEVRRQITKTDKIRAKYYEAHTNRDWGAIGNYTLIVDTGKFGTDGAAALIEAAVRELVDKDEVVL